tara:strand:- start:1927 stop:2799 length:873 start_codon:yes stop_codon:yes gene_type:complete
MAYIGNQPANSYTSFDSQSLTGNGTAGPYTLSHAVSSANEIEVFVNFVRQRPGVAYTVSGTQLTMTGNVASTDDFYVVYQGKAVQTVVPPDGSVSTAQINDGAITNAKINTMASSKLTGALPAIDGSSLTGLSSGFTFLSDQTLTGNSQVTFTGFPSGVQIIKVIIENASVDTTGSQRMRIGDSGGLATGSYIRGDTYGATGVGNSYDTNADSWRLHSWSGASNNILHNGELVRLTGNKWFWHCNAFITTSASYFAIWQGYKELSGELTQLQFYPGAGSFDSGVMRVAYQ